ncbi:hypothetical protein TrRE_jg8353 [Triparma retinervis]|uniref:Uncharacterized protein n=1 Tax=Triparma retinervis TaxID=2557542 RepID=A0A9W7G449_9STRA|nr:hypothetical protein TrRE_jg8353 [Triparma retinervis]
MTAIITLTPIQGLVFMPPFACMCASGDGRLTDDYLSSLSPTPDKYRITPAFYKVPEYVPPKLEMEEETAKVVGGVEVGRLRKRDKIRTFFRTFTKNIRRQKKTLPPLSSVDTFGGGVDPQRYIAS